MKFRKRPVVIDAWQWNGSTEGWPEWMHDWTTNGEFIHRVMEGTKLYIPTLEGSHIASKGDWIIKGVKGELYACKPDIFKETYEVVGPIRNSGYD